MFQCFSDGSVGSDGGHVKGFGASLVQPSLNFVSVLLFYYLLQTGV